MSGGGHDASSADDGDRGARGDRLPAAADSAAELAAASAVGEERAAHSTRSDAASGDRLTAIGRLTVTAMGLGHLRPAPGTWGSLPPVVVAMLLLALGAPWWAISASMALLVVVASWLCVHFGSGAERTFGRKDPSQVVIDEVAGQAVALLVLPWWWLEGETIVGHLTMPQTVVAIAAFFLFRAFDIVKPPPARGLQRLGGGVGILIDDLLAGAYALGAAWCVAWFVARGYAA
ncbi:MAG: phosphatidylglycerophosphatase A [Phycisphaeraceae bacterium]|nr:phosphatidylglycerophosphatase A [Phycisphaeraceae bacterium]